MKIQRLWGAHGNKEACGPSWGSAHDCQKCALSVHSLFFACLAWQALSRDVIMHVTRRIRPRATGWNPLLLKLPTVEFSEVLKAALSHVSQYDT